jgi:hypothetical protein
MSDTPTPAPTPAPVAPGEPGVFLAWLQSAEQGAATVYNDVVRVSADVSTWQTAHPEIGPLIQAATGYATSMLTAAGLPVPVFISAGEAVLAALKKFAALDATVDSGH